MPTTSSHLYLCAEICTLLSMVEEARAYLYCEPKAVTKKNGPIRSEDCLTMRCSPTQGGSKRRWKGVGIFLVPSPSGRGRLVRSEVFLTRAVGYRFLGFLRTRGLALLPVSTNDASALNLESSRIKVHFDGDSSEAEWVIIAAGCSNMHGVPFFGSGSPPVIQHLRFFPGADGDTFPTSMATRRTTTS